MTDIGPPPAGNALVERVKRILLTPKDEWLRIEAESMTIAEIYKSHVIPLAAIGPIATLIGGQIFGHGLFGVTFRPSLMSGLITALVSFALALLGTYLVAMIIEWLAPQFDAVKDRTRAFKVAAYSFTAAWVAGIFGALPAIGFLSIVGLYSLYLMYLGLPVVMKAPADKGGNYAIVTIIASVIVGIVLGMLTAPIAGLIAPKPSVYDGSLSGKMTLPGGGSVDMGELEKAGKKLEETTKAMQNGQGQPAIATDILKALMPTELPGGLKQTSIESASAGAAGLSGSNVEARYGSGDTQITLTVTDLGAVGGLAALGGALNVESSKETGTSYEKVGKVDGRITTEKYDSADRRGQYGTMVGDRIMIQAEGNAPSIDVLKAAVAAVDLAKVEALTK